MIRFAPIVRTKRLRSFPCAAATAISGRPFLTELASAKLSASSCSPTRKRVWKALLVAQTSEVAGGP